MKTSKTVSILPKYLSAKRKNTFLLKKKIVAVWKEHVHPYSFHIGIIVFTLLAFSSSSVSLKVPQNLILVMML